jgi:hypothetical protein
MATSSFDREFVFTGRAAAQINELESHPAHASVKINTAIVSETDIQKGLEKLRKISSHSET